MARRALIRADAGPSLGMGHVMRCLALAGELAGDGWAVSLACTGESLPALRGLAGFPYPVLALGLVNDPVELEQRAGGAVDLLIVDHYGLDHRYETRCRHWAGRILVIDDLADRRHDADMLLDPTYGRLESAYRPLVPAPCHLMLGPTYALLRPEFAEARQASLARRAQGAARRILVSMGATDPVNATSVVVAGLTQVAGECEIDVVLGSAAPHLAKVAAELSGLQNARFHVDCPRMADLMTAADLCIGAAGSTSWERCTLGLPTLMVVIADNQKAIAAALVAAGAVGDLGSLDILTPKKVASRVGQLLTSPEDLRRMAQIAAAVCDGRGAARIKAMI